MSSLAAGVSAAALRLRSLATVAGVGFALLGVLVVTLIERRASPLVAADRALSGVALGVALPLLVYGLVTRACAGTRLDASLVHLARHGADRRLAAAGLLSFTLFGSAVAGVLISATAVIVARAPADPRLVTDLLTSSWIGLLAGLGYGGWFALASTVGREGGGRFWVLVLDWLLGAGVGAFAVPWPRSHVQNLLGASPVLNLPQWSASLALVVLAGACSALALSRTAR